MKIEEFTAKSFIFAIAHGYDVVWRKFNSKLSSSGCNITEALTLIAIFFEEGKRASPSALALALRTSRGNISHCLSKLERQKHVRRIISESDARQLVVHLQPSGARLAQRFIAEIEATETLCEEQLGGGSAQKILRALFALGD